MNDERQSRLLADYLAALHANAHAAPPAQLDPELAAMARRLSEARLPLPDASTRERVWQRALAASRPPGASANGRSAHALTKETHMTAIPRALPTGRKTHPLPLIAALLAVALLASVLFLSRPPSGPADIQPGMLSNPEQGEATATPFATATLTASPSMTLVPTSTPVGPPVFVRPEEGMLHHQVQEGDTLGSILQFYGYTDMSIIDRIFALNPSLAESGDLPPVGEMLRMPAPTLVPAATPTLALFEHRVQAGETLASILDLYGQNTPAMVTQVTMMNPAVRDGSLKEGDVLLIPVSVPTPLLTATPVPFTESPLGTATPIPFDPAGPAFPPTVVPDGGGALIPTNFPPTVVPPVGVGFDAEPYTLGETVTGELSPMQPLRAYSFTADATGPIYARARTESPLRLGIGFQVSREGSGGGGGGGGGGDRATTTEITGSQYVYAGDHVVVLVNSSGPESGTFELSVVQAVTQPIAYGESVDGEISAAQPVAHYSFAGEQGDRVSIRTSGVDSYDTTLTLIGSSPDQTIVYDDDGGAGFDAEILDYALPASGQYSILVEPGVISSGRFTLTLERAEPMSLDDGPQVVRFNNKVQPPLAFTGAAGQNVQLNARAVAGSTSARFVSLLVYQDGLLIADISRDFGQLSGATQPAAGSLLTSGTLTVPRDGVVTVQVSASTSLASDESLAVEVEVVPVE